MNRYIIAVAFFVSLSACNPQASSDVAAAAVALTAAEKLALSYTSLPRCPAATACSDEATVTKIKAADNTAYDAIKAAEANPALVGTAVSAITTLRNLIPGN